MKIPELISYLSSELPKSSPTTAPESLRSQFVERVGWLFPEEIVLKFCYVRFTLVTRHSEFSLASFHSH